MSKIQGPPSLRFGVNIDHLATVRNARGEVAADPVRAAQIAEEAGADEMAARLREDRPQISNPDMERHEDALRVPLNSGRAATAELQAIALRHKPHTVCFVPQEREQRTTDEGRDVARDENRLAHFIAPLAEADRCVSIFIAEDERQVEAPARTGATVVERHTGGYCDARSEGRFEERDAERARLTEMAAYNFGLAVHAGHGLSYDRVSPIAALSQVVELNIGDFPIGEADFTGPEHAIRRMRSHLDAARSEAHG